MNTGIVTFSKLPEMSAIYPFQGTEVAFALALFAFFIAFFALQISMESKHHKTIIGNFTASPAE